MKGIEYRLAPWSLRNSELEAQSFSGSTSWGADNDSATVSTT